MMLLLNQFNKKIDFCIITITSLWLFPNLILCTFDFFAEIIFRFVGIKWIGFLFLATPLIMPRFKFRLGVKMKIGSWFYLTCCISLLFSHFLMCCLTNQTALGLWNYIFKINCKFFFI